MNVIKFATKLDEKMRKFYEDNGEFMSSEDVALKVIEMTEKRANKGKDVGEICDLVDAAADLQDASERLRNAESAVAEASQRFDDEVDTLMGNL